MGQVASLFGMEAPVEAIALTLEQAKAVGALVLDELRPVIVQGELAGSARRAKPYGISDVDIVIEPTRDAEGWSREFLAAVTECPRWVVETKSVGPESRRLKLRSRKDPRLVIELYLATPDRYGWILMLRTGPSDFTRAMVQACKHRPTPHYFDDGYLWRGTREAGGVVVPTPTEEAVFAALEIDPVPVYDRREASLMRTIATSGR